MGYALMDYNEEVELNNIYDFSTKRKKGNGSNTGDTYEYKEDNSTKPIKKDDLVLMQNYFKDKNQYRNLLLLNIGCCVGLRESDLLRLRWNMIFNRNYEYQDGVVIIEQKTGKKRSIIYSETFKKAVEQYLSYTGIRKDELDMSADGYIAKSRQLRDIKNKQGYVIGRTKRLCEDAFSKILRDCAKELKIEYHISSHSLRKYYGVAVYEATKDVALLQYIFGHSSQRVTLRYLCLETENVKQAYEAVEFSL